MNTRAEESRERRLARYARALLPTTTAVSGSESDWSRWVTWSNGGAVAFDAALAVSWGEFHLIYAGASREPISVIPAAVVPATEARDDHYNPDMVAEILRADAQPPEAEFNNVVDMLDWLNRD